MASLVTYPKFRAWVPSTGVPAASYVVRTFAAGTSTPLAVYTDSGLTIPAANPFTLDANGEAVVYAAAGTVYKIQLYDPTNTVQQWSVDQVTIPSGTGGGGSGASATEWIQDTATPTFVNGTSLQFTGVDKTGIYHVNRRIKTLNSGGTIYSTITSAVFSGGNTTLTVVNDTGSLDSGLSQISYGILDSVNVSYPANIGGGGSSAGGTNILYNGGFDIWQRGAGGSASFTGINTRTYTADRWQAAHVAGNATVTQVAGAVSRYGCKLQRTAGNAVTAAVQIAQSLEINDCIRFGLAGSPFSLSFNVKAGANFSASSNNIAVAIVAGKDASDTSLLAGYTSQTNVVQSTVGITTTSTRYSISGTLPGGVGFTEFGVLFQFTPTGTAGADDSITLENVQLEANPSATPFGFVPFGLMLSRCLRYYQKSFTYSTLPVQNVGTGVGAFHISAVKAGAVSNGPETMPLQSPLRTTVTVVTYNPAAANANFRDTTAGADCSAVSTTPSDKNVVFIVSGNASTAIANDLAAHWTVDADIQ